MTITTEQCDAVPATCCANSVIAAIDARRPGMTLAKQQSLLFFTQGHHIAHFGVPLFDDPIAVTSRGVVTDGANGSPADPPVDEGSLNTIGYVIERYSALSPTDLRTLIQASRPWQAAAAHGSCGRIDLPVLREWFRRDDETNDPDDERPNQAERTMVAEIWTRHVQRETA